MRATVILRPFVVVVFFLFAMALVLLLYSAFSLFVRGRQRPKPRTKRTPRTIKQYDLLLLDDDDHRMKSHYKLYGHCSICASVCVCVLITVSVDGSFYAETKCCRRAVDRARVLCVLRRPDNDNRSRYAPDSYLMERHSMPIQLKDQTCYY